MNKKLRELASAAAGWLPDALMIGGAAAVSYGAWMVYAPAGPIVAGLFSLGGGVVLARGGK